MGRISYEDKVCIQTLHEQGLGAKAIRSRYPAKQWSLNTLKTICRHITKTGSAVSLWLVSLAADGQNQLELRRTLLLSATRSALKRTIQMIQVRAKVPVRLPKRLEWATDLFGASRKWISSCQLFGACQRRFSAMLLYLNDWNDAELFWDVWPLIRCNRCSLPTKRISIWTLLSELELCCISNRQLSKQKGPGWYGIVAFNVPVPVISGTTLWVIWPS